MNWVEAFSIALVCVSWVLGPGLALGYLLGLRGVAAWGMAPVIGVALVATTAVGAEAVGVDWSVTVVLVVCAAAVLVVGAAAYLLRRHAFFHRDADPRGVTLAAVAGLVPAAILGAMTVVAAMGSPDALSQRFDTPFHYNALAYIRDSHHASSLTMSALGNPDVPATFYPAAWHDLGSLVMLSTGASIPVTANMLVAVIAVVVWPLSCLLLVRQLFGRNRAALAVAGVLSVGFPAFPWDLMGWGVLWPNLLGLSIAPAALAVVVTLTGWARDDAIGRPRAWFLLVVAIGATGLAHPNVLFSLAVLSVFFVAAALVRRGVRLRGEGRTWRGGTEILAFLAVLLVAWWWAATTPALAVARGWNWQAFETPAAAFGEVLLNATNRREAIWLLSAVVLAGMLAARRRHPVLRLVVLGHLATAFLYILAAGISRPDTEKFIGYWYNDSHRLAAMLPITGVPLAVGGILFLAAVVAEKVPTLPRVRLATSLTSAAVGLAMILVGATGLLNPADREVRVSVTYPRVEERKLVTDEMRAFYDRIAERIPPDAVVAGNPFDGSVLLWALADREVLYPHFLTATGEEQAYLAAHLDEVATDPRVCEVADELGVEYLLIGRPEGRRDERFYVGIEAIAESAYTPGLELLDSAGPSRLYRLAACDDEDRPVVNALPRHR
jgi:hypothetical protein